MKFQINFEYKNGYQDYFIIEANTIEEIKELVDEQLKIRNGLNAWSQEL